jgi:hypothetical protein
VGGLFSLSSLLLANTVLASLVLVLDDSSASFKGSNSSDGCRESGFDIFVVCF